MHRTTRRRNALETLNGLTALLFCVLVPIALVIAALAWIVRKVSGPAPAPAVASARAPLDEFEQLVQRWVAQGRLANSAAAQVHALIAEERLSHMPPAAAPASIEPSAIPPVEAPAVVAPLTAR